MNLPRMMKQIIPQLNSSQVSPMEPSTTPLPSHFPALDGLRGLAILLVLFHMLSLLDKQTGLAAFVYFSLSSTGWVGVQLFFVLSGFLITGILLDSQRAQNYYSGFYMRRTLRIFPLYFSILTVAFIILPAIEIEPSPTDHNNHLWLWTYTANWAALFGDSNEPFPHFWSLAVEEQFYLVWPLLIRSMNPLRCVRVCLIIVFISLAVRAYLVWKGMDHLLIYQNSFCRMDALAFGSAAAAALRIPSWKDWILCKHKYLFHWSIGVALASGIATRDFVIYTPLGSIISYFLVALIFALLLTAAAGADVVGASGWVSVLRFRPLQVIGKYSYGMYIFHKPLHDFLGAPLALKFNTSQSVLLSTIYIVISTCVIFAAAFISWHLFEKHFLKMKQFFVAKL